MGDAFGRIFLALLFWPAVDQHLVLEGSQRLLDHAVPATLERFRLARNVEQLRLEGEHVTTDGLTKQQGRNRVVTAAVGDATGETARQPLNGDAPPSVDTAPT